MTQIVETGIIGNTSSLRNLFEVLDHRTADKIFSQSIGEDQTKLVVPHFACLLLFFLLPLHLIVEGIRTYLRTRPTHLELEVNGKHFYMVHGFTGENAHDEVWNCPTMELEKPIPECRQIVGHTKVLSMIQPENKHIL